MELRRPLSQEIVIELLPSKPFYPPFVDGRDREFSGYGPFVTVLVILRKVGNLQLSYEIFMDAVETHNDFTFFQGQSGLQTAYSLEKDHPGYLIATILTDAASGVQLLDTDPHLNSVAPSYGNLVKEFIIEGDRRGDDKPWVQVVFNPIKIKIIESPHAFLSRIRNQ
ncbi:MAG: hypothetical protein ACFFDJ_10085 [Candidatus Odinarchaeota archaeon]